MGRRFRRIRRFAHQVVQITRRLWAVCCCCGMLREEIKRDTVSLASVLSGNVGRGPPRGQTVKLLIGSNPISWCPAIVLQNPYIKPFPSFRVINRPWRPVYCCQSKLSERALRIVSHENRLVESLRRGSSTSTTSISPDLSPKVSRISKFSLGSLGNAVTPITSSSMSDKIQDGIKSVTDNDTKCEGKKVVTEGIAGSAEESLPIYDNSAFIASVIEFKDAGSGAAETSDSIMDGHSNEFPQAETRQVYDNSAFIASQFEADDKGCGAAESNDMPMDGSSREIIPRTKPLLCMFESSSSTSSEASFKETLEDMGFPTGSWRHITELSLPPELKNIPSNLIQSLTSLNSSSESFKNCQSSTSVYELARDQCTSSTSGEYSSAGSSSDISLLPVKLIGMSARCVETVPCVVEYASDKLWRTVRPEHWKTEETICLTKSSVIELVYVKKFRMQLAVKEIPTSTSQKEADLLAECQGTFVSRLRMILVEGEVRYLCMEYYEKRDLAQWLNRDKDRKYFGEEEAVSIASYLLVALDFLHLRKVLHLDVKPSNVLIEDTGYPILCGFGSAWKMDEDAEFKPRRSLRSPYTCPELLSPSPTCPNQHSDFWSVACVFYEVVTGKVPTVDTSIGGSDADIVELTEELDVSMMSRRAQDYVLYQLAPVPGERLGFEGGVREVMRHWVFHYTSWDDVRFGHRQERSELLGIFEQIEEDELKQKEKLNDELLKEVLGWPSLESEYGTSRLSSNGENAVECVQSFLDFSFSSERTSGRSSRSPRGRPLSPIPEEGEGEEEAEITPVLGDTDTEDPT